MGTNYYLHTDPCKHCGRADEVLHIGKSSAGWCFSLRVYRERDINDLQDWLPLFRKHEIRNEYGEVFSADRMLSNIQDRHGTPLETAPWGYTTIEDFYARNHAEPGPNNLLRHKIGNHCVGHGSGTWDLIRGEFC